MAFVIAWKIIIKILGMISGVFDRRSEFAEELEAALKPSWKGHLQADLVL